MSGEPRKEVLVMLQNGQGMKVLTRMPIKEIREEFHDYETRDPAWVVLEGLDGDDRHVPTEIIRSAIVSFMIKSEAVVQVVK